MPSRIPAPLHTVSVTYDTGSDILIRNQRYDLLGFNFHTPSEHTKNGRRYDMEVQIVHQLRKKERKDGADEDGTPHLAILALWFELPRGIISEIHELRGEYINIAELNDDESTDARLHELMNRGSNPFLESLNWNQMWRTAIPGSGSTSSSFGVDSMYVGDVTSSSSPPTAPLNLFDLLPFDQGYITYSGSLTSPPCSEIVTWYIFKDAVTCSVIQRNILQRVIGGRNARPIQEKYGRNVTQTKGAKHSQ